MQPMAEDWQRAVCVVAHPDDLEYGAASAVARWTAQGKVVSYVLVTSGEAGIAGQDPADVGPLREEEERRSAAVVGVSEVVFLGHPDGVVEYGVPLRRDLARAFRQLRPEVVVTMSFERPDSRCWTPAVTPRTNGYSGIWTCLVPRSKTLT
jgi:LmbE family N-acetylglucosaminyl deacetylase